MTPRHRVPVGEEYPADQSAPPVSGGALGFLRPRSISAKLIRILVVSLVMVTVLLGVMVYDQIGNFQDANRISRMVSVTLSVQDAVHQLQKERGLTNGYLSGGEQFKAQVPPQRKLTDAALGELNTVINNPANADAGAPQVRTALNQLVDLTSVRAGVDNGSALASPTFAFYTNAISVLNGLQLGLDEAQDGTLRQALQALYALGDAKEYTGQERGLLNGVFSAGHFASGTYQQLAQILGEKAAALASYTRYATATEQNSLAVVQHSPAASQALGSENIAVAATDGHLPTTVDAGAWWTQMTTVVNDLRTVQQSVGADATARAVQLRNDATHNLELISVLALLAIAIEVALVIGASRSIIGPLGHLAEDADEVAQNRLPEAVDALQTATELDTGQLLQASRVTVPDRAGTEIHRVAAALDRVRETALTLAGEQAVIRRNTTLSLANLGRRNQNLVRRQLSLISDFEREELDPSALANMFELDHLATRMRRNAESLLVLVGDVSPRPWSEPLPVSDVIRAALSEVEGYRRVALRRIDEGFITGSAVTEIAHMVAELVENGLAFSPPDMEVEIYGRRSGTGYLLAVVDAGVGMTQEAITTANARLRDEENYLVAPTRFLGHYVVGRLARPLKVEVRLTESPVTGITARISLPNDLLTEKPAITSARPGRSGERERELPPASPVPARESISLAMPAQLAAPEVVWPVADEVESTVVGLDKPARQSRRRPSAPDLVPTAAQPAEPQPTAAEQAEQAAQIALERTRNGLVKRQRRGSAKPSGQPGQGRRRPVADPSLTNRSPEEVGSMLASFHRGHKRGEAQGGAHSLRNDQRGTFDLTDPAN